MLNAINATRFSGFYELPISLERLRELPVGENQEPPLPLEYWVDGNPNIVYVYCLKEKERYFEQVLRANHIEPTAYAPAKGIDGFILKTQQARSALLNWVGTRVGASAQVVTSYWDRHPKNT